MIRLLETTPRGMECPGCGENDIDLLVCQEDDETVKCQTCGTSYDPLAEA